MVWRIAGVRSTEQSDIMGVKRIFDTVDIVTIKQKAGAYIL